MSQAGHSKVISVKVVLYSIPCPSSDEIYLDRQAAIMLSRVIKQLKPEPVTIQVLYMTYQYKRGEVVWNDDTLLDALCPAIFQPISTTSGRELYRVAVLVLQQYTERNILNWEVSYHPGEEYDNICRDIQVYIDQCSLQLQQIIHQPLLYAHEENNSFTPVMTPARLENPFAPGMNGRVETDFTSTIAPFQLTNGFVPNLTCAQGETNTALNVTPPFTAERIFTSSFTPPITSLDNGSTFTSQNNSDPPKAIHSVSPNVTIARLQNSNTNAQNSFAFATPATETTLQSGFTTPANTSGPFTNALDSIVQDMDAQMSPDRAQSLFPQSQFSLAKKQAMEDDQAAIKILSKIKVLAINFKSGSKHRWSLQGEKQEIQSMSINTTLNIGRNDWTIQEKIERLFKRYDVDDEQGNESFQRGLLMIVIRLMRQKFVNESGKKQLGNNYTGDFDKLYTFPTGYLKKAGHLCRLLVACGHPCILVVLIRLAIRNRSTLLAFLDDVPIRHFCRFIATGKVTDMNQQDLTQSSSSSFSSKNTNIHKDLSWMHGNVILPLLQASSKRVSDTLYLVDATLKCDEETCLRAIVHNTKQIKYSHFLEGTCTNADWARGKVLLESKSIERQVAPEYSIERNDRTFHHFKISTFAHTEHFDDPPKFLQSKTLDLTLG